MLDCLKHSYFIGLRVFWPRMSRLDFAHSFFVVKAFEFQSNFNFTFYFYLLRTY